MAFDGTAIDCTALPGGALLFVLFGGGGIIAVARVAPSDGSICCLGGGGNGGLLFFATGPLDFCTGAGLAGSHADLGLRSGFSTGAIPVIAGSDPQHLTLPPVEESCLPSCNSIPHWLIFRGVWLFNDF